MREYLFRGKMLDYEGWAYGNLIVNNDGRAFIAEKIDDSLLCAVLQEKTYEVNHETVGQDTGLVDKNGVKIFEGDIVQISGYDYDEPSFDCFGQVILTPYGNAILTPENNVEYLSDLLGSYKTIYEVLGNITENKELLEVQE